eukprot:scpid93122/ scgid10492/ NADH dehydrogenase [ubiquinone] 1 alpha subcomplex subunit 5; Complex I subunit B13; Complex I-13kD-B; NADH-ubiquinone oxidoreductase 13 kDa-B subunit
MATFARTLLKRTTGVTGLAVHPQPLESLRGLYGETLEQLKKIPESAAYRRETEALTTERLQIVKETTDVAVAEKAIGFGQIEEAIQVAERELRLVHRMQQWKPWENLIEKAPEGQWARP